MGLWQKMVNWGREKKDQAEAAIGDDIRDGKFAIVDAKKEETEFARAVAKLNSDTKLLRRKEEDLRQEQKKFSGMAKRAAAAEDEEAVVQLAGEEMRVKNQADELARQIQKNDQQRAAMQKDLNKIRNRIAAAEQNFSILEARKKGAEARKNLAKARAGLSEGKGLSALDDLERAVDQDECEAEALEEMSGGSTSDLEDKYGGGNVDAEDLAAKYMTAAAKKK